MLILPLFAEVDYNSEIQPIFNSSCISCHSGSDAEEDLSLTSYDNLMNGGESGDVVIPYDHANSLLWQYITYGYMPPGNYDLTGEQVDIIAQWINEGALIESNGIEGRWHPVNFVDNTLYEFVDTELFADAGLRYTIYSSDGTFGGIEDAIPNPNPYMVDGDIIMINTFFENIATYEIDFRCNGQVVDFYYYEDDNWEGLHSTYFRQGFDYLSSECFGNSEDCFLTTDDILGPYYFENAPFRNVIAHEDEPGQRLYISGIIKQNNCENNISGALIELWQANDEGCYGIVEDCNTGNPENDYFNLRGKFFSDENGNFTFESILPGYYGTRPRHIHIKVSTPDEEILVSQLYFGNDPYCENDEWCQDAEDRIILLEENESGLYGGIDIIINSTDNGIILGDVNFDNLINVQDIVLLAGIILNDFNPIDFQIYSANVNNDGAIDILDIIQIINIILRN